MVSELGAQRRLHHPTHQGFQQAVRAGQLRALGLGSLDDLSGKLLVQLAGTDWRLYRRSSRVVHA
jgi:hypothetical protein